jgi:hypothetical protein
VNPVTNEIYVANLPTEGGNSVAVIDEQQVQTIPLDASITPLSGNLTARVTPVFDFTTSSSFSPTAPAVDNVLFEIDTWQGAWITATYLSPGQYSGQTGTLQPGVHIFYAYATDGLECPTSSNYGGEIGALIGTLAAYLFLVSPPNALVSPSSLSFGNELVATTSAAQSVTLNNNGAGPLTISSAVASGDYSVSSNNCPASLAPSASCTIEVTFTPSVTGRGASGRIIAHPPQLRESGSGDNERGAIGYAQ